MVHASRLKLDKFANKIDNVEFVFDELGIRHIDSTLSFFEGFFKPRKLIFTLTKSLKYENLYLHSNYLHQRRMRPTVSDFENITLRRRLLVLWCLFLRFIFWKRLDLEWIKLDKNIQVEGWTVCKCYQRHFSRKTVLIYMEPERRVIGATVHNKYGMILIPLEPFKKEIKKEYAAVGAGWILLRQWSKVKTK